MAGEGIARSGRFVAVAEERSFTRAAAKLGVSQSALSQTIRALEAQLGIRLLTRTTRNVAPTEAGERLLRTVAPRFAEINCRDGSFERAQGQTRRNCPHYGHRERRRGGALAWHSKDSCRTTLDIKVEIIIDYGLTDIVAGQVDAGVRFGEQVAKDMIAVRIGLDIRMAVAGDRHAYFAKYTPPRTPQDLTAHECINLRLPTHGLYALGI